MRNIDYDRFMMSFRRYAYTDKFDNDLFLEVNKELGLEHEVEKSKYMKWLTHESHYLKRKDD